MTHTTADLLQIAETSLKEAHEAIRARDELLSIASHELKTPLTSLILQLQLLQRLARSKNDEKTVQTVNKSLRQIHRIAALVDNLMDVSRIQAGKLELNLEEIQLSELIREMVDRFSPQLEQAGSSVTLNLARDLVGKWDRSRIEQIVLNLLSNAIKYAPRSEIRVCTSLRDERSVCISVSDHGPGIPHEKLPKIFERFERATSSRSTSGLGLGLFIVKQIVEAHRGSISVSSIEGSGTEFRVELPLHTAQRTT